MKLSSALLIFLILIIATSGCTINVDLGDSEQAGGNEQLQPSQETEQAEQEVQIEQGEMQEQGTVNITVVEESEETIENNITVVEENLYEDIECSILSDAQMELTMQSDDTEDNAKEIIMCSVNKEIMNGINYKYYTFTLAQPAKVYLMVDGAETGAWQVGIIGHGFEEGANGQAAKYHAELPTGTYIIQVRLINSLGSTCSQSADEIDPCYFEFSNDETKWWIQGDEAGTAKLGFRLTLSTSEIQPNNTIEFGRASMVPVAASCSSFDSKTLNNNIPNDETQYAYQVELCDEVNDVFTSAAYEYYLISLNQETQVKFTLTKPEGAWQIGVSNRGWQDSAAMGEENVVYSELLPAGNHIVWVRVTNNGALSGDDWSCRQIVTDGTCYWLEGVPPSGVNYLNFKVSFDSE